MIANPKFHPFFFTTREHTDLQTKEICPAPTIARNQMLVRERACGSKSRKYVASARNIYLKIEIVGVSINSVVTNCLPAQD